VVASGRARVIDLPPLLAALHSLEPPAAGISPLARRGLESALLVAPRCDVTWIGALRWGVNQPPRQVLPTDPAAAADYLRSLLLFAASSGRSDLHALVRLLGKLLEAAPGVEELTALLEIQWSYVLCEPHAADIRDEGAIGELLDPAMPLGVTKDLARLLGAAWRRVVDGLARNELAQLYRVHGETRGAASAILAQACRVDGWDLAPQDTLQALGAFRFEAENSLALLYDLRRHGKHAG